VIAGTQGGEGIYALVVMTTTSPDRRIAVDRRQRAVSFRYPERRTGFDRRALAASPWMRALHAYRSHPSLVMWCAAAIAALSVVDLLLTWRFIGMGATELNPVMAGLFDSGLAGAAAVKVSITAVVVAGIVAMRRYRRVLEFSLVLVAALVVLVGYEVVGLVALG
jgi:hypothetical protein